MEKKLGTRLCFEVKWQDFRRGEQPSSSTNTRNISPLFIFLKMGGGGGTTHKISILPVARPCLNFTNEMCFERQDIFHLSFLFFNPLNPELNPICYLLALLGAHHFLHVSRIRVKSLILRLLMSYIYGAPILDVSRSNTTQHSR